MKKHGLTPLVVWATLIASLGGLLFGYHTGAMASALNFIYLELSLTTFRQEMVVSMILVGGLVGTLIAGFLADRWGRRESILAMSVVYVGAALFFIFIDQYQGLLWGRFLAGLGIGMASVLIPLYLSEVAPPRWRGAVVSFNQLAITVGVLLSYFMGYAFLETANWRLLFALSLIPALFLLIGVFFLPETPSWLFQKGEEEKALGVLEMIRRDLPAEAILKEMAESKKGNREKINFQSVKKTALIGVGLAILQQASGINAILAYAPTIFRSSLQTAHETAMLATVAIGVINVVFTGVAMWLIDLAGRRKLLLIGSSGVCGALSLFCIYLSFPSLGWSALIPVCALMAYIAFFAVGLGPMVFLILSEIYPLAIRSKMMSVGVFANWAANYVVSLTFLSLMEKVTLAGTFGIYGAMAAFTFLFVWKLVPETKGKTLEEIARFWQK